MYTEAEFMNGPFRWGFWAYSWEFSGLDVSVNNVLHYKPVTIKTTFVRGGGGVSVRGSKKLLVEVSVTKNSKEENYEEADQTVRFALPIFKPTAY